MKAKNTLQDTSSKYCELIKWSFNIKYFQHVCNNNQFYFHMVGTKLNLCGSVT